LVSALVSASVKRRKEVIKITKKNHRSFLLFVYYNIFTWNFLYSYKLANKSRIEAKLSCELITCGGLFVLSQQMEPDWQVDVFAMITFGRSQKAAIRVNRQKPGHGGSFG